MIRATPIAIHAAMSRCWIIGRCRRTSRSSTTASSPLQWRRICFRARHAGIFGHRLSRAAHIATSHSIPFVRLITSSRTHPALRRAGVGSALGMGFIALSSMSEWQAIPGIHTNAPNQSLQATAGRSGATTYIMKIHPLPAALALASGA
jgi:hypothetical protein